LNIYIRRFPANIVASVFGFEKALQFEAKEWADVAPTVDFGATSTSVENIPTEGTE
jgi:LemA protein